jgi:hypothetical protein
MPQGIPGQVIRQGCGPSIQGRSPSIPQSDISFPGASFFAGEAEIEPPPRPPRGGVKHTIHDSQRTIAATAPPAIARITMARSGLAIRGARVAPGIRFFPVIMGRTRLCPFSRA